MKIQLLRLYKMIHKLKKFYKIKKFKLFLNIYREIKFKKY